MDYTLTVNSRTDIGSQIVTISLGEGSVNNNYTIIATDTAKLTINPTLLLPSTGGIGLLPFVFLGLIFIFSGFFYFIHRKKKQVNSDEKNIMSSDVIPVARHLNYLNEFIGSPTVSARESPITFTLHNRMFESDKMPSISQNDGINIPDNFQGVKGLNGVTFAIYDVSDEFYKHTSV
ncbi:hypothetical protein EfmJHP36_21280 [Enterococcus faecium]|nr:hypothetical protein EfmJHP36_21280 [Enterococcus faecium]